MDRRYIDRVALLVSILPYLEREPDFALKGGTAINLFEHDLPRLSVDIDLGWLRTQSFAKDTGQIEESLTRLARQLSQPPLKLDVTFSRPSGSNSLYRIVASRDRAQVQIETSPVMRGTVHPPRTMELKPSVEARFGSARTRVFHFSDLYAGKLAAALSRQHPRDLFDVKVLLETSGINDELWRTFLVYLTASPRPAAEILAPAQPTEFARTFETQFSGMTSYPVSVEQLMACRESLVSEVRGRLDKESRAFLISVEHEAPDFSLIGLPGAAELPGVRWKLQNLARRSDEKRRSDVAKLMDALEKAP